jgi:hypothetical protein
MPPAFSKDTLVTIVGKVSNNGEILSRTQNWEFTSQFAKETRIHTGEMMVMSHVWNITVNTQKGGSIVLPAQKAYFPEITATDPIVQNGAKVGFVIFRIPDINWHVFMSSPATFVVSFQDSKGKKYSKSWDWVPTDQPPPPYIPGLPNPEPLPKN